jgi:hypothetical protein
MIAPSAAQAENMTVVMKGCIGHLSVSGGLTGRACRARLNVPVVFEYAGGTATGQTVDISESGILVDFDQIMDIWTTGDLSVEGEKWDLQISARVARVDGRQAAFAFRGMTSSDRERVRDLIAHINSEIERISR